MSSSRSPESPGPVPSDLTPCPPTTGQHLAALLARLLFRLLGATLRYRVLDEAYIAQARRQGAGGRVVFVFRHGRQFPLVYHWRRHPIAILTSLSRDGTLQSLILGGLGYHIVRGSSSRGGARGLVGIVRALRAGYDAAFAVDGPRGPLGRVKPGALFAARRSRTLLLPITASARPAHRFERAWDRYLLPLPFSRVVVAYDPPLEVPEDASEEQLEQLTRLLEERLQGLTERADRAAGRTPDARGAERSG